MISRMLKVSLIALALTSTGWAIPTQEAGARTVCRTYWKHGVKHQSCSSAHRQRTNCRTYWKHGVKHQSCQRYRRTVCRTYWNHGVKQRSCHRKYY